MCLLRKHFTASKPNLIEFHVVVVVVVVVVVFAVFVVFVLHLVVLFSSSGADGTFTIAVTLISFIHTCLLSSLSEMY